MNLSSQLASFLNRIGRAWWVEVQTQSPECTYFFGPFSSEKEAEAELPGYLEDLRQEGAQEITTQIKRCQPSDLTIYDDAEFSIRESIYKRQNIN